MFAKVYEDREKGDIAVAALKRGELIQAGEVHKAQRIFFEEDI